MCSSDLPILGRKEDQAPSGQGVPASRIRLEAVGPGMAVQNARTLLGVPGFLWTVDLGSRSGLIGPINFVVNCAGARSAGNPLATWEREMFQKSHSPVKSGELGVPEGHPRDVPRQTQ